MIQKKIDFNPQENSVKQEYRWSKIVYLSHIHQNLEMKSHSLITVLKFGKTIVETIIPCFLLLISQKLKIAFFENIYMQTFMKIAEAQNENTSLYDYLIQIFILLCLTVTFFNLFLVSSQKIKVYTLYTLTVFSFLWGLFNLIEVNIFYRSLLMNESATGIKLFCMVNIFLAFILSILYKIISHSDALILSNFLCCRFGVLEILGYVACKIINTFIISQISEQLLLKKDPSVNANMLYIFAFLLLIVTLNNLKNEIVCFTHAEPTTEKIYKNSLVLRLSSISVTILCILTKSQVCIDNYFYLMFTIYFSFYLVLHNHGQRRSNMYQLKKESQIKKADEAILYIRQLNKIFLAEFKNTEQTELHMIKSLYENHKGQCVKSYCFCQSSQQIENQKKINDMFPIYRLLAIEVMQRLCQIVGERNSDIIKVVLWAKLKVHDNFIGISFLSNSDKLKKFKNEFLSGAFLLKYQLGIKKMLSTRDAAANFSKIQKILESDRLAEKMIENCYKIIELKKSFWNSLTIGAVNQTFRKNVQLELALLKEFDRCTQIAVNLYENSFFLLSLVIIYQRSILMKEKISQDLIGYLEKLTQSAASFKNSQKKRGASLVEKIMYSASACSIEISTKSQEIGIIISVSNNTKHIFNVNDQDLIGSNINKIMPQKMQAEHNRLLQNWVRTCSWSNIGKIRQVFCLDTRSTCFAGRIYFKPIQRQESINLIGVFIKQNDQDYLLVDNENTIVAAGQNFVNVLDPKIIGMSVQDICQDEGQIQKWADQDGKILRRLYFYSMKFKQTANSGNLRKIGDIIENGQISQNNIEIKSRKDMIPMVFTVGRMRLGNMSFKYLKLIDFLEFSRPDEKKSMNIILNESNLMKKSQIMCNDESKIFLQFNPSVSSSNSEQSVSTFNILTKLQRIFYSKQKMNDRRLSKIVLILRIFCGISFILEISKIIINQKGYRQVEQLLLADSGCSDNLEFSMILYHKALTLNIKMQEYLSNYDSTLFNSTLHSSLVIQLRDLKFEKGYLNGLITSQILKYQKSLTSLNSIYMFQYQKNLVKWVSPDGKHFQITTFHFIDNFVYFCSRVYDLANQILGKASTNILQSDEISKNSAEMKFFVNILTVNFQQLSKTNELNLLYYEQLEMQAKESIQMYTYIKISIAIITVFLIVIVINSYLVYREKQNYKLAEIYKFITQDVAKDLYQYYKKLAKPYQRQVSLKKMKEDNKNLSTAEESDKLVKITNQIYQEYNQKQLDIQNEPKKGQVTKISIQKVKDSKMKILLVIAFFCVVGLNVLIQTSQSAILDRSYQIILLINDLIQSENQLISVYLTQRSHQKLSRNQLENLLEKIQSVQVEFTRLSVSSFILLTSFDPNYERKMSETLTKSVCQVAKNKLPSQFFEICMEEEGMKYARAGIVNQMNYFNRQLINFLMSEIKNEYVDTENRALQLEKFDRAFLHMFKVYQIMQQMIMSSLKLKMNNQKVQLIFYMSVELGIFLAFVFYLRAFSLKENRQTANRVGRILLIPVRLIKNEIKILKNFQTAIDYFSIQSQ